MRKKEMVKPGKKVRKNSEKIELWASKIGRELGLDSGLGSGLDSGKALDRGNGGFDSENRSLEDVRTRGWEGKTKATKATKTTKITTLLLIISLLALPFIGEEINKTLNGSNNNILGGFEIITSRAVENVYDFTIPNESDGSDTSSTTLPPETTSTTTIPSETTTTSEPRVPIPPTTSTTTNEFKIIPEPNETN